MKKILSLGPIYDKFWSNSKDDGLEVTEIWNTHGIVIECPYNGKIYCGDDVYVISDYAAIVIFSVDKMSRYLYSVLQGHCKVIGNPISRSHMRDKVAGAIDMSRNGIPIVQTFYSSGYVNKSICETVSKDIVIKPKDGSFGEGVKLFRDNTIRNTFQKIVQPYIECNSHDERWVIVDGKCVCAIDRRASDPNEFRSNLGIGGIVTPIPITEEMQEFGKKVYDCFPGCLWTGIDVMRSVDGEVYVGEVNHFPHHKVDTGDYYETVWGHDFRKDLYDYLIRLINEP